MTSFLRACRRHPGIAQICIPDRSTKENLA
jgi:hypothetical protein